ncbi:MAG TPA: CcmD family protein [Solirubrobacteraceae bacterium]|nr:CcmD family protein [Solirubrobacteraceae bacterium]
MPALPLHEAGKYVAAAYVVVFTLVLVYVAIMAARLSRVERELGELLSLTEQPSDPGDAQPGRQSQQTPDELDVGRPESSPV